MLLRRFNIGIIGYGNLGRAAVRLLNLKRRVFEEEGLDLVLTCVLGWRGGVLNLEGLDCETLLQNTERSRLDHALGFDAGLTFHHMIREKAANIVLEFTPTNQETGEPGLTHIQECLAAGVHVATGNKGPVLTAWPKLLALAREKKLLLGISATTGGALPTLLNGRDAMSGSTVLLIEGILNGTTNFILERMEQGNVYEEALKEAQSLGIAEANPSKDVEGWDTAIKLLIMARIIMGVDLQLKDIPVSGIAGLSAEAVRLARDKGRRIKLIGRAWREGNAVCAEVAPRAIGPDNPLYNVRGKDKAARYVSDTMGELFISGGASDPQAAAAAALRDVINAWRSGILR